MKQIKVREIKELFLECSQKDKARDLESYPNEEIIKSIRVYQVINILEKKIIDIDGVYGLMIKCAIKI